MFCKAITSRGTPCIAPCKGASDYCRAHSRQRRQECPICLESVPHFRTLACGHHICLDCLPRIPSPACPLCRREDETMWDHRDALDSLQESLVDLWFISIDGSDTHGSDWWEARLYSADYMDVVNRVVDLACSLHTIVFREPTFLAGIWQSRGIPHDDSIPCIRRFRRCVESFSRRTGILPRGVPHPRDIPEMLMDVVHPGIRYLDYLHSFSF